MAPLLGKQPADLQNKLSAEGSFVYLARKVAEDVGCLIGGHHLDDVRGFLRVHVAYDLNLCLGAQLRERLCRHVGIEILQEHGALVVGDLTDDVRDIGGVELRDHLPRDREGDGRELRLKRLEVVPAYEVVGERGLEHLQEIFALPLDAEPPQYPPHPDIDGDEDRLGFIPLELDVVYAHDFHTVDVDDLLVEDVTKGEKVVGAGIVLIDVVMDARRFVYRLVGTREVALRGRDPTGKSVAEGFYGASAETSMASYQDVVDRRAPRLERREFTTPEGRYGREQVILLPLSDDGARVTKIIVYTHHMLS